MTVPYYTNRRVLLQVRGALNAKLHHGGKYFFGFIKLKTSLFFSFAVS
jgi:hypothetical protein